MKQPSLRGGDLSPDQPSLTASEAPDFAAARSLKRQLLEELRAGWETGTSVRSEELLPQWPGNPESDPDVASLLFEEYCQRQERGEEPVPEEYEKRFPQHKDSLAGVLRHQALLRSLGAGSGRSLMTLALPSVGDEVFGFRLRAELGRGAFARVFLGEQNVLAGRQVVLKISAIDGEEPQTLAQLQHTHIVPIYSVHEDPEAGLRAVCMPFFGGASLSHVLQSLWAETDRPTRGMQLVEALARMCSRVSAQGKPWAETDRPLQAGDRGPRAFLAGGSYVRAVVWLIARLAEALQHAHQRGVLHRDIKPSNILLSDEGQPMLLDFNLAQNQHSNRAQATATLGGTVAYMAPEHLRALAARDPALARQVDHRADLYSLGMVLYEMLIGHSPFDQSASYSPVPAIIEAMAVERSRAVPSLRQHRRDIPWGLESIIRTCLAPDPAQRYQQADHCAEDLRRFLEDQPLRFAPELSWAERVRKWTRRHPRLAAAGSVAGSAALLLAAGAAILVSARAQLQATQARAYAAEGSQARERQQAFEAKTVRALCLVNTATDLHDHVAEGLRVCEEALDLYGILERDDWQEHRDWQRLAAPERHRLAEDAREILLLLARARVHLATRPSDGDLSGTLRAFLAPIPVPVVPVHVAAAWQAGHAFWGPRAATLLAARQTALRQALQLLERAEALSELPPSRALWQDRACYWHELGDAEAGQQAQQRAEAIPLTSPREHYLLATTYARQRRYREAIGELNQALRLNPKHFWSWLELGICHQEIGEDARAIGDFTACIVLWPDFAWGYFNLARVLHQRGSTEDALTEYTAALGRDPDFVHAYLNRGLVYLDQNQPAQALADFDSAAVRGRDDALLHSGRGMALESLRRFSEADAAFAQVWARDPTNQALLLGYGFAVCRRLPEAAQAAFEKVLAVDPRNPRALYGQGMLAAERQRGSREALELFHRALEVDPSFVAARRGRAVVLAQRGAWEEARQEIDWCVAVESTGVTLYAAACVYALGAEQDRLRGLLVAKRALAFLREAFARGYGRDKAMDDPDLAGIRHHEEFRRLLQPAQPPEPKS